MKKLTNNDFINKSNIIHNYKYDYSLTNYIKSNIKVKIICKKCNSVFEQRPNDHLSGHGCIICNANLNLTPLEIIEKSNKIHHNKYDYSLFLKYSLKNNYKNQKSLISIICPIHGEFNQQINNHLNGKGCKNCNRSKGEINIQHLLNKYRIEYEKQKSFDDCKYKNKLYFDFYLKKYNTVIEFDGKQHYEPTMRFGGLKEFENMIKRDIIKNEYCEQNNISLIRIKYDENIEEKLKNILK